jgi:hypothetical protein
VTVPVDPAERAAARAAANRAAQGITGDVERILRLPVVEPGPCTCGHDEGAHTVRIEGSPGFGCSSPACACRAYTSARYVREAAAMTRLLARPGVPVTHPLRPIQGAALAYLQRQAMTGDPAGEFLPIGVGHGKTLISMLAGEVMLAERPMLLIPPAMRDQWYRDVAEWSARYLFKPPRMLAYSELSQQTATAALDYYAPDLLICDEAHALRHASSARTKRLVRYLRENPQTRLILLSGTITGASILDFAHLIEPALRSNNPLPLARHVLEQWASVLDPDGEPDHASWESIWPLAHAQGAPPRPWDVHPDQRQAAARDAFKRRVRTTPGILATSEASVGANLLIASRSPSPPDVVTSALRGLVEEWALPDHDADGRPVDPVDIAGTDDALEGGDVVDAATLARAASQLSSGFFYVWDWTYGGTVPDGRRDEEWIQARSAWFREVNATLRYQSRAGYDSVALVTAAVQRGEGSRPLLDAWRTWEPLRERRPPPKRTIWLSDYLIRDVVEWARVERTRGRAALIWYQWHATGRALAEAGLEVFGQGSDISNDDYARRIRPDDPGRATVALSIAVHGKGKNLQAWNRNLIVEPPASGTVWEQLLGRTHRQGQKADDVYAVVYQHTDRARGALERASAQALYIEQTQGTPQKLVFARRFDDERGIE